MDDMKVTQGPWRVERFHSPSVGAVYTAWISDPTGEVTDRIRPADAHHIVALHNTHAEREAVVEAARVAVKAAARFQASADGSAAERMAAVAMCNAVASIAPYLRALDAKTKETR